MKPGSFDNHYSRLGVPFDATHDEIRRAYHQAARKSHPDVNPTSDRTTQFLSIKEAYEVLSDENARAIYDLSLQSADLKSGLKMKTVFSRDHLLKTNEPQLLYAMIQLDPIISAQIESAPVNVCLVIDKSTSMKGKRMEMVKLTAQRILDKLQPGDFLSVVAFSDRAEVVLAPSRNIDQKKMQARISLMQTGGGTEMFHGLEKGFELLQRHLRSTSVNHIFLITDGHTYGDEDKCLELADQIKASGVTVSALGIGSEWNEQFLDKLAAKTGGSSVYIAFSQDLRDFLEKKFSSLHHVFAENLRLVLNKTDTNASLQYVFRVRPDANRLDTDGMVALGNLFENEPMVLLIEILIQKAGELRGPSPILKGEIRYEIPGREIPAARTALEFILPVLQDSPSVSPPQEIIQAMSRLTLYRMQEQARTEIDNGDIRAATRRLKRLASQVEATGDEDLASSILDEAGRLEGGNTHLGRLNKSIMYGTKSLVAAEYELPQDDEANE